ncbi:snRNP Sm protein F [Salpingoeca rosetta]|uniref:Sm protein F n=1 Tax=Salpingoeca rosetta (strain ATCC 50818 / BSB-021) TaxID=946362 RepID=F2UIX1_SALR5|nr:snRNP Sm protein F [Salpingoeca rosetta]EGD77170.1 snRNP Sm protein F [Salpingoeca rosetta]|eukprot:XP_004991009.1 snRNP Sm protein F [Salpingoeca rosetta]
MSLTIKNPKQLLQELTGKSVAVKLKWGMEYRGVLKSFDNYMNFQLLNTEEYIDGVSQGNLGECLIRAHMP